MEPREHPHAYGHLTYLEIRERIDAGWIAVIPTGCTEQQGPHLPVDFDTWFAEWLMLAAAERAAGRGTMALVLPAIPFGPTPEHRHYGSGYVHMPRSFHELLINAVLHSMAEQGFQRIVVWRGCGGHDLTGVVDLFNQGHEGTARAFLPTMPYHDIWRQVGDPSVPGGHADSFTTSIVLHLRPQAIRAEQIPPPEKTNVLWDDPDLDFSRYSRSGVIGDATQASAALGAALWEASVQAAALVLQEVAGQSIVPDPRRVEDI